MSNIDLVQAKNEDVEGIYLLDSCENDAYSIDTISKMVLDDNTYTLVARANGLVVGYVSYSFALDEAELIKIVVDREFRGQGIASSLLKTSFLKLKSDGIKTVFLEVRVDNSVAKKCYEKMGFEHFHTRQKYYNGIDAMLYRLSI